MTGGANDGGLCLTTLLHLCRPMASAPAPAQSLAYVVRQLKDSVCGECSRQVATINCEQCHELYCAACCDMVHSRGRRAYHTQFLRIQICGECEAAPATRECRECQEFYCLPCCDQVLGQVRGTMEQGDDACARSPNFPALVVTSEGVPTKMLH